jgi:hypothetical protein
MSSFCGLPVANAPDVLQPCGLLYYSTCVTPVTDFLIETYRLILNRFMFGRTYAL